MGENIVDKCEDVTTSLIRGDVMTGVFCLAEILQSNSVAAQYRALLLLEFLVSQESVPLSSVNTVCTKHCFSLQTSASPKVAIKAKKLNLILNILANTKST